MSIKDLTAELKGEFCLSIIGEDKVATEYARLGCVVLELLYGGGDHRGIAYGTMVTNYGDTSSGKSMTGNEIIAAEFHRRAKGKFAHQYEDGEEGNTFDTSKLYGIDIRKTNTLANIPKRKLPKNPKTVQDMDARYSLFLDQIPTDGYGIYIMDSLDALSSEDTHKRAESRKNAYKKDGTTSDGGTFGMDKAKFLSQEFFREQGAKTAEHNAICILISQARENITAMGVRGVKDTGGKAKGHWVSMKAYYKPINDIYMPDNKLAYGTVFEVVIKKSRDGKIKRSCRFVFDTKHGIDDVKTSLDFLFDTRTLKECTLKASSNKIDFMSILKPSLKKKYMDSLQDTYTYEELHPLIRKNKEFQEALDNAVIKKWQDIETASESGVGGKYATT